ncbi:MAG: hypothetical protein U0230_14575 [Polyangiales bacterium]
MGLASLLLGLASLVATCGGMVFVGVPYLGLVASGAAVMLAIVGLVLGGLGYSRANADGEGTGLPVAGLVASGFALIPALVVGFTCGACNLAFTSLTEELEGDGGLRFVIDPDAGVTLPPDGDVDAGKPEPVDPTAPVKPPPAGSAPAPAAIDDAGVTRTVVPVPPSNDRAPPPAFPPPPVQRMAPPQGR